MATKKLYDADSRLLTAEAIVRACDPLKDGGYDVLLDQTVFFPEEGGQPSDLGKMDEANVLHCRIEGDELIHHVDAPLPVGKTVSLSVDDARRFDFMQQHTGEHLLSFSFFKLFSAANVGFHLAAADYSTIDFDKPLTADMLLAGELLANRLVWRDLPVTATYYDDEEQTRALPLRKRAEGLKGRIRIVSIRDADMCTCCAPHCHTTGEIGCILITDAVSYKGGTRVTFVCGGRALSFAKHAALCEDTIARRFSVGRGQALDAVAKLSSDYGALKKRERELSERVNGFVSADLGKSARKAGKYACIVSLQSGMDAAFLKELAQMCAVKHTLAVLLSAQADGRLFYVVSLGEGIPIDVCELIAAVNAATGGKGGGRNALAQGMAPTQSGVEQTVSQLADYFTKRLSALK